MLPEAVSIIASTPIRLLIDCRDISTKFIFDFPMPRYPSHYSLLGVSPDFISRDADFLHA